MTISPCIATRKLRAGDVANIPIGENLDCLELGGGLRIFACVANIRNCPPNGLKRAELFTLTTPAQVKAFAETGGRDIEFDDLAEALQNRITAGAGSGLPNAQPLTKIRCFIGVWGSAFATSSNCPPTTRINIISR